MEGLVNYSSEDEHDEQNYKSAAERGGHLRRTPSDARRRGGDYGAGGGSSSAASHASTSFGRRSSTKDEDKYASPSAHSSNRASAQSHYSRDNRGEQRDNRSSAKDSREFRDHRNGNKAGGDYKHERFNRSTEYNYRDQRRDNNFRDNRRPRDDDRNQRGAGGGGNFNNRYQSNSSHHKDSRYNSNNNRYNDSSASRRFQRSHDDERAVDNRSERHGTAARKARSPTSHSPSPTTSSSHSKRYNSRNDEHRTRNRSRSRSHTRSPSPQKRSLSPRPSTKPLDLARSTALDLEKKLNANESKLERESSTRLSTTLRHTEAVLTLPLSDATPKAPTVIAVAPITSAGNSEPAVIQLPSYYNPSVINPNKYAEQVQKRKLIWGAKKAEDTSAKWGHAQFSQDSDGKVASKFMRLMGIKGGATAAAPTDSERQPPATVTDVKSREKMFTNMEQQYEVARQVTHTMRGVGLGFGSQARQF